MRLEANAPIMISFDQAMNQDYVNVQALEEGNNIGGQATAYHPDATMAVQNHGGGTPVWQAGGVQTVDQKMDDAQEDDGWAKAV